MKPVSRTEFFNDYWLALEKKGWPAVVLHSWKDLPEQILSDIDYAVDKVSMRELLSFLAEFSRKRGWRLIQAIEHEPKAFFCVCMQSGGEYESLLLDVTSGYRRIGHKFISASTLVNRRKRAKNKSFFVPHPIVELQYILSKGAAKNKDFDDIEVRVSELLNDDESSLEALKSVYPGRRWDRDVDLQDAVAELYKSNPSFNSVRKGRKIGFAEWMLYLRRIFRPTGVLLKLGNDFSIEDTKKLGETLRPAFRHVNYCTNSENLKILKAISKVIRTSLVIHLSISHKKKLSWFGNCISLPHQESAKMMIVDCIELISRRLEARVGYKHTDK